MPIVHNNGECYDPYFNRPCMFCDGGLSGCEVCGAFEGAWPDDCPGKRMTAYQGEQVYAGLLNYRTGAWRSECCRVMRPVHDREAFVREQRGP